MTTLITMSFLVGDDASRKCSNQDKMRRNGVEMQAWESRFSRILKAEKVTRVLASRTQRECEQHLLPLLKAGPNLEGEEINCIWDKLKELYEEPYEDLRTEFYLSYVMGTAPSSV